MRKRMLRLEICGIFFILVMSVFEQNLYVLSDRNLIGIMFGSVNNSIWEITKTIMFPYVIWSMLELLTLRPPFHKFVIVKTISLYALGVGYICLCIFISAFGGDESYMPDFIAAIVSIAVSLWLSYRLLFSDMKTENLFLPAIFMLLLFVAVFLSFTTFPPQMLIFRDRDTGLYGLIPQDLDIGAIVLSNNYN